MQPKIIFDKKIRVGLVGCGRIALNHINAIKKFDDHFEIVAVCDPSIERSQTIANELQAASFVHLENLLQECAVDLIVLCTPSGLHAEQACLAAQYGKHVITEKPMATRWQDGLRMVKSCDKAKVHLFVVKQNRQNPTIKALKKAIDDGRFGRIYLVHSNVFWTRPQSYYDQDRWRGTWEFDGGAFMNQASHYVDLLDWLVGPVESVQAMMATLARNIEVEDTGVLNIKWRSGTLGSMSTTMLTYRKNLEGSITLLGERGTVKLGGTALNEILHWEFQDNEQDQQEMKDLNIQAKSYQSSGHAAYYENVAKVFRGEGIPHTDGREGLRSLELLVAAYLAKKEGRTIHLPLEL